MSITKETPNTIHLGGDGVLVNDLVAIETITPGMIIERQNDSGTLKFGVQDTASEDCARIFALNQSMLNKGVDDNYAAGDLVEAIVAKPGCVIWGLIASGQNITQGQYLEAAGDGTFKVYNAGVRLASALESKNATALTRIRVEVM